MERDSFVFYGSFYEALSSLDDATRLACYDAVSKYALSGEEPQLEGVAKAIFALIKPQIDANNQRYINGCKGGKPKANQNVTKGKPKRNQKETKVEPNENENVNVNENVNDNENDNENVNESPMEIKKKSKKEKAPSLSLEQMEILVNESLLSTPLQSKVGEWIRYKQSRNEPYKEMGFKSLLSQIHKYEMQDGMDAVLDVMDLSMSNEWKGIIWDKIEHRARGQTMQSVDWSKV